jgi:hypothetical protein
MLLSVTAAAAEVSAVAGETAALRRRLEEVRATNIVSILKNNTIMI